MDGWAKLIDSIDRNFQRLLRWVYPGALFFSLSILARPEFLSFLLDSEGKKLPLSSVPSSSVLILLILSISAGAAIYLFHANVINNVVSAVSIGTRWELNTFDEDTSTNFPGTHALRDFFDTWAKGPVKRWGADVDRMNGYMDYAWATYHATFITGWLSLVFFHWFKTAGSVLATLTTTQSDLFQLGALLFFLGAIVEYARLARIPLKSNRGQSSLPPWRNDKWKDFTLRGRRYLS